MTEKQRQERIKRMERMGLLDPDCSGCREFYKHPTVSPFAPNHNASEGCESGKRPHCTCDACF